MPLLRDVYAKAGGFCVGVVMYEVLGLRAAGDVFDRLSDTNLAEELLAEQGQPPSRPEDPGYGRRQPGWVYTTAELPALPAGLPGWLAEVMVGLVKSDHSQVERRLGPAEATGRLEIAGLARAWQRTDEAGEEADAAQREAGAAAAALERFAAEVEGLRAQLAAQQAREAAELRAQAQAQAELEAASTGLEQAQQAQRAAEQQRDGNRRRLRELETVNAEMHQTAEQQAEAARLAVERLQEEVERLRVGEAERAAA
jgi:hypothetical protein